MSVTQLHAFDAVARVEIAEAIHETDAVLATVPHATAASASSKRSKNESRIASSWRTER